MITGTGVGWEQRAVIGWLGTAMDTVANPDRTALGAHGHADQTDPIRGTARGRSAVPLSILDLAPVGVETTPGKKDHAKMRAFIGAAKAAGQEVCFDPS